MDRHHSAKHWKDADVTITAEPKRSASVQQEPWEDTREWIARAQAQGQLRVVNGANWQHEIGEVAEMLDHNENSPAVLFDNIPGYPQGRRVIVNCNGNPSRQAITLNLPDSDGNHEGLFRFWRKVLDGLEPIPPVEVAKIGRAHV